MQIHIVIVTLEQTNSIQALWLRGIRTGSNPPKQLCQPSFGSPCLNLSQSSLSQVSVGNLLRSVIAVIGLKTSLLNDIIGFNYVIMPLKVWGWKVTLIFSSELPQMKPGGLNLWVFKVLGFFFFQRKARVGLPWHWWLRGDYSSWGSASSEPVYGSLCKETARASVRPPCDLKLMSGGNSTVSNWIWLGRVIIWLPLVFAHVQGYFYWKKTNCLLT